MDYISHLFWGFIMAFIGLVPPGMLNMTAVRTTIEKGKKAGLNFSAGAASIVFIQASIALIFANYLNKHPEIISRLRIGGIFIFLILAVFFYLQTRKEFKGQGKQKNGNPFLSGMMLSSINMLAIPFYLGLSTFLSADGRLLLEQPYITIFVIGAVFGAFSLFATYSAFADTIIKKANFIAKNINYILSLLFVILALITFFKV